ncbi:MAG: class I SAM-dependent methyltransferase [Bacteroidia bacterium]
MELHNQTAYWSSVAGSKTFSHPINTDFFTYMNLPTTTHIVDVGCGYGRCISLLAEKGYNNLTGIDSAEGMIAEAQARLPEAKFLQSQPGKLPLADEAADVVMLYAVLTCIPENEAINILIDEIYRILKPGGYIYLSDNLLNDDARNIARYVAGAEQGLPYGSFILPEGVVCRHFRREDLLGFMQAFSLQQEEPFTATTMNGNKAQALQLLLRK